jgi:hypothetical protein
MVLSLELVVVPPEPELWVLVVRWLVYHESEPHAEMFMRSVLPLPGWRAGIGTCPTARTDHAEEKLQPHAPTRIMNET